MGVTAEQVSVQDDDDLDMQRMAVLPALKVSGTNRVESKNVRVTSEQSVGSPRQQFLGSHVCLVSIAISRQSRLQVSGGLILRSSRRNVGICSDVSIDCQRSHTKAADRSLEPAMHLLPMVVQVVSRGRYRYGVVPTALTFC